MASDLELGLDTFGDVTGGAPQSPAVSAIARVNAQEPSGLR
jgi:hypothetical protein